MAKFEQRDRQRMALAGVAVLLGIAIKAPIFVIAGAVYLLYIIKQHGFQSVFNSNRSRMETIDLRKGKKFAKWFVIVLIIIAVLPFAGAFFTVIEAGQTGVGSVFGKVRSQELHSGFHFKNPFMRVTKMSIRTHDYTMSITHGEAQRTGADAIRALTKEGLDVDLDITVLYHLEQDNASEVYEGIGLDYDEVLIRPQIRSVIREVIAQYEAKDIYSSKRQEASQAILDQLTHALLDRGIVVEDVLLRNVQLPDRLANSIQLKLEAEQDAQRYDFLLQKEEKEAQRKRVEAAGQRDSQRIIAESLTQNYLQYLYIQSLKDREGTIYVPTNPNNGVPLFRGL